MNKPTPNIHSKKLGRYRLRLTTYQTDRQGGMLELLDTEFSEADGADEIIYEGHYSFRHNATERYRKISTGKQAIDWAWRNS